MDSFKLDFWEGVVPTKNHKITVVAGKGENAGEILKVDK